jgi:hypothetical protein
VLTPRARRRQRLRRAYVRIELEERGLLPRERYDEPPSPPPRSVEPAAEPDADDDRAVDMERPA